jgi:glycosyltransferase involved in cell wall biosynthesis
MQRFAPTHVLLRTGGAMARRVLGFCRAHQVNTLVAFANTFDVALGWKEKLLMRRLVRLLNDQAVRLVGNHKQPATESMVDAGVDPRKVVAWDWPNPRRPGDWPTKTLDESRPARIVYVGTLSAAKGVGDLLAAVEQLRRPAGSVALRILGDGAERPILAAAASSLPVGTVEFLGRVANDLAFEQMLQASVVCVPSRHEFPEGMPLVLTEALASRTPVIISDHPVFMRGFRDGEGVRFFRAGDPASLARVIDEVLSDGDRYAELSRLTEQAFRRVDCNTLFGDLVDRWKETFR